MDGPSCRFISWFTCFAACILLESIVSAHSWCTPHPSPRQEARFEQKINRFWEYQEQSNTWVEISTPFDLMSCINGTCTKVGSIARKPASSPVHSQEKEDARLDEEDEEDRNGPVLPVRKRISLTRMSESSVWWQAKADRSTRGSGTGWCGWSLLMNSLLQLAMPQRLSLWIQLSLLCRRLESFTR